MTRASGIAHEPRRRYQFWTPKEAPTVGAHMEYHVVGKGEEAEEVGELVVDDIYALAAYNKYLEGLPWNDPQRRSAEKAGLTARAWTSSRQDKTPYLHRQEVTETTASDKPKVLEDQEARQYEQLLLDAIKEGFVTVSRRVNSPAAVARLVQNWAFKIGEGNFRKMMSAVRSWMIGGEEFTLPSGLAPGGAAHSGIILKYDVTPEQLVNAYTEIALGDVTEDIISEGGGSFAVALSKALESHLDLPTKLAMASWVDAREWTLPYRSLSEAPSSLTIAEAYNSSRAAWPFKKLLQVMQAERGRMKVPTMGLQYDGKGYIEISGAILRAQYMWNQSVSAIAYRVWRRLQEMGVSMDAAFAAVQTQVRYHERGYRKQYDIQYTQGSKGGASPRGIDAGYVDPATGEWIKMTSHQTARGNRYESWSLSEGIEVSTSRRPSWEPLGKLMTVKGSRGGLEEPPYRTGSIHSIEYRLKMPYSMPPIAIGGLPVAPEITKYMYNIYVNIGGVLISAVDDYFTQRAPSSEVFVDIPQQGSME